MAQLFQEIEVLNHLNINYMKKGDILIGSGTVSNSTTSDSNILPVGSSGSVLVSNTSATFGVKWDNTFVRNFPQSATDNRIARWNQLDGAGSVGQYIQSSNVVIDDNRNMTEIRSIVAGATNATRQTNYLMTIKGGATMNGMHTRISDNAGTIGFHIQSANGLTQYMHIHHEGNITFGTATNNLDPQPIYRLDVRADDSLKANKGGGKVNCFKGYFLDGDTWPSITTVATTTTVTISGTGFASIGLQLTIPSTDTTSDYYCTFTSILSKAGGGTASSFTTSALHVNGVQQIDSSVDSSAESTIGAKGSIKTSGVVTNISGGSTIDIRAKSSAGTQSFNYTNRSLTIQRINPQ